MMESIIERLIYLSDMIIEEKLVLMLYIMYNSSH